MVNKSEQNPPNSRLYHSGIGGAGNYHLFPPRISPSTSPSTPPNQSQPSTTISRSKSTSSINTVTPKSVRAPAPIPSPRRFYRTGIGGAGNYHPRTTPTMVTPGRPPAVAVVQPPVSSRKLIPLGICGANNYHRCTSTSSTAGSTESNGTTVKDPALYHL